ncbi:hypothetical protein H4R34_004914 [Dimargaris verticillata]|uniref:Importin-13 n=1 Tax=Dimargaris verticillata TaxID=2761393 RepID=A0A9W8AXX2_9FUNG|nr:hypothetical protein H4R34_004914 [Dimargaris verticillata]
MATDEQRAFFQSLSVPTPEAVKHLHQLQKEPSGWALAEQLMHEQSPACQFYGAHTLQVKISRDWATLTPDQRNPLRDQLVRWIAEHATGTAAVLTKLCLALVTLSIKTVPTGEWTEFIPTTLQWLRDAGQRQFPGHPATIDRAILEFLSVLPEETHRSDLVDPTKRAKYAQEITSAFPLILATIRAYLGHIGTPEQGLASLAFTCPSETEPGVGTPLQAKTLQCLARWVPQGLPLDQIVPVLHEAMYFLPYAGTCGAACDLIQELFDHPKATQIHTSMLRAFLPFVTSNWLQAVMHDLVASRNEDEARPFCKLLVGFAEMFADYLVPHLADPAVLRLVEYLVTISEYPGYFPVDQELSELPLNFWYLLQEAISDWVMENESDGFQLIPADATLSGSVGTPDQLPLPSATTVPTSASATTDTCKQIRTQSHAIFQRVAQALLRQLVYPSPAEFSQWPRDMRDRFRAYRRDVGDTLLTCYYVLRTSLLDVTMALLLTQVFGEHTTPASPTLPDRWRAAEAALFALRCVAETVPNDLHDPLSRMFDAPLVAQLKAAPSPLPMATYLSVLGAFAEWLNHHPTYLPTALACVTDALGVSELALPAASAFRALCETCKGHLKAMAPSIIEQVVHIVNSIPEHEKPKMFEAIGELLQPLPAQSFAGPFTYLAGNLLTATVDLIPTPATSISADQRAQLLAHLGYLTACSRGLQPPDAEPTGTADATNGRLDAADPTAWPTLQAEAQAWSQIFASEAFGRIRTLLGLLLERVGEALVHDDEVMDAVCLFLKSTLRQLPSLSRTAAQAVVSTGKLAPVLSAVAYPLKLFNVFQLPPGAVIQYLIAQYRRAIAVGPIDGTRNVAQCMALATSFLDTGAHFVAVYGRLRRYTHWYQAMQHIANATPTPTGTTLAGVPSPLGPPASKADGTSPTALVTELLSYAAPLCTPDEAWLAIDTLLQAFIEQTLVLTQAPLPHNLDQFPHLVISLFGFLHKYATTHPVLLTRLPDARLTALFDLTLHCLTLTDRMSLKSVLAFALDIVGLDASAQPELKSFLEHFFRAYGQSLLQELLLGIGGKLPRSMVNHPTELLFKLVVNHFEFTRECAYGLLAQEGFPSNHVDAAAKKAFVTGILGNRQYPKFKDVVHRFSMQCRNMTNLMYGMY